MSEEPSNLPFSLKGDDRLTDEEIDGWMHEGAPVRTHRRMCDAVMQLRADLAEATAILRAILAADERGQGQPFAEAMARAEAFVEGLG